MSYCNNNCRQGRDCPHRRTTGRIRGAILDLAGLAALVLLCLLVYVL